jgi:uncharacterized protein
LPLADGYGLFNARTGSVLRLQGADAEELAGVLSGPPVEIDPDELGESLAARLRRNGFVLGADEDELAFIRERYWAAREGAPVALLVTTTMDCNLGCYYCYETRSPDALRVGDIEDVVEIARERLARQGKRRLHVDWYGGEPLMNLDFLEQTSLALQEMCSGEGIAYQASAISNGTHWPSDVGPFIARHKICEVQISFDGLKANHDRRRRFRSGYRPSDDASSFDLAADLVDDLLLHTRVDVRFNADPGNAEDLPGFIGLARERGWFDAPFRCVVVVARLAAYSDRSAFMRRRELTDEEYDQLLEVARTLLPHEAQDNQDLIEGFPAPKTSVCGALAFDSAVVGADGLEYRCGLQVGERHRAVGRFGEQANSEAFPDRAWWAAFDPTTAPTCSRCSFLPVCWGGCPKRHLENSRIDLDREGRFWRLNLPRMIGAGFGEEPPAEFTYTEADQFRTGRPDVASAPVRG